MSVKAVGICGSDIPRVYETGAHRHPLICGHEFAGQIEALGEGVSSQWSGKRVGVFPLIPCKECEMCRQQKYEMCSNYNYLGSRCDGGFAEYVSVPEWNLIELPDNVSFKAAAMLEPMAVSVHAMRRALSIGEIDKDSKVAVIGLGTIGLLLTMFLKDAGYENLLLIGNKDFQKQAVLKLGISEDCFCDEKKTDISEWIMDKTNGKGADVFFECVGKNETAAFAVDNTAASGRIVMVGNPHDEIMSFERDVYWKILRRQITVTGTWNSSFLKKDDDDWHYVLSRLESGKVAPEALISHVFALEELEKGLHIMRDKTENYCKVMIEIK